MQVREMKEYVRDQKGAKDTLRDCPNNYERILQYIDELDFWSKPDYTYIYELLTRAMRRAKVRATQFFQLGFYSTFKSLGFGHSDSVSVLQ